MSLKLLKAVRKLDAESHAVGLAQGMNEHTEEMVRSWDDAAEQALFQVQEIRLKMLHIRLDKRMDRLREDVYSLEHTVDGLGFVEKSAFRYSTPESLNEKLTLTTAQICKLSLLIQKKRRQLLFLSRIQNKLNKRDFKDHIYPF